MSKVKIKQIKKVVGDVDLSGMFEEMMGIKDAEPELVIRNFVLIRNTIRHICKVLNQFTKTLRMSFPSFDIAFDEIDHFVTSVKTEIYLTTDNEDTEAQYASVSKSNINNLYRKLKEKQVIKRLIQLCNILEKYKNNFNDQTKLRENFVNQEPGLSFKIFDFSSLDLKILWIEKSMTSIIKRYILSAFASLHKHTYALYSAVTAPNIDIDKFTKLLLTSIAELKKIPKLHRCNAAFGRIEQSVELLKDKFSDYYRESMVSRNPDSLVTSFIVDVSNQGGADARLTREFRQIIQYMHEMSQKSGKNKDPQVQKIFEMLNSNFSLMEKHTGECKSSVDDIPNIDSFDTSIVNDSVSGVNEAESLLDEKKQCRLEKQRAKKKKKSKKKTVANVDSADVDSVESDKDGYVPCVTDANITPEEALEIILKEMSN
jgi:hypothetical protein